MDWFGTAVLTFVLLLVTIKRLFRWNTALRISCWADYGGNTAQGVLIAMCPDSSARKADRRLSPGREKTFKTARHQVPWCPFMRRSSCKAFKERELCRIIRGFRIFNLTCSRRLQPLPGSSESPPPLTPYLQARESSADPQMLSVRHGALPFLKWS